MRFIVYHNYKRITLRKVLSQRAYSEELFIVFERPLQRFDVRIQQ